jgi:hypothetical protein
MSLIDSEEVGSNISTEDSVNSDSENERTNQTYHDDTTSADEFCPSGETVADINDERKINTGNAPNPASSLLAARLRSRFRQLEEWDVTCVEAEA